ncbi:two-component system LytT family response regulator [Duganella sp. 1224]|uniref:LytR/AlgR family response regulator transcription factor n=1 Tax=Duganella sp. 1224 TaxID=2587052 RepID=UPI0015C735C0|nr:LytTR family DNA-binding domain-containing protein [Duganella sp. 1224]NYE63455.1 two-component system LytT family response regulator [Duganella sp. 1224]
MKLRALIVDDEAPARANLKALLRRHADIEVLADCDTGAAALAAVRALRPELLFLDIQMPECDGFDVLEMLGGDVPPAVVFVTAYDQHALRAFDVGALDYLLKPYSDERFNTALARARERLQRSPPTPARLVLKQAGQVLFVPVAGIDWISAADYYASLHVGAQTHLLRRSIAELERDLDPAIFCRIHRSTMINLARLQSIELGSDGEHEAVLTTGVRLRISRSYRKTLLDRAA